VEDLMVDVLEQIELERFAGLIGRLDPVDDAPPHAMHEVPVEEPDGQLQLLHELELPCPPV